MLVRERYQLSTQFLIGADKISTNVSVDNPLSIGSLDRLNGDHFFVSRQRGSFIIISLCIGVLIPSQQNYIAN